MTLSCCCAWCLALLSLLRLSAATAAPECWLRLGLPLPSLGLVSSLALLLCWFCR